MPLRTTLHTQFQVTVLKLKVEADMRREMRPGENVDFLLLLMNRRTPAKIESIKISGMKGKRREALDFFRVPSNFPCQIPTLDSQNRTTVVLSVPLLVICID